MRGRPRPRFLGGAGEVVEPVVVVVVEVGAAGEGSDFRDLERVVLGMGGLEEEEEEDAVFELGAADDEEADLFLACDFVLG